MIGVPYSFILLGANLQALVMRWFGLNLHWSFWFVLALGLAFALCYWGIRQSMNVDLTFLAFEMGICLVLAVIVLFHVGQQGDKKPAPEHSPRRVWIDDRGWALLCLDGLRGNCWLRG